MDKYIMYTYIKYTYTFNITLFKKRRQKIYLRCVTAFILYCKIQIMSI